jgi:hypothetical protein
VNNWTVRFGRAVDVDRWADGRPFDVISGLHDWIARCIESGPPADAWLSELEEGYRYRYWIIEVNVTVEFIAVSYERWMLITRID